MERDGVARSFGEARLMNPYPHVAQDEGHGDEEQSQARIACTGVNSSLPMLAIAGFDAEPFAIPFADSAQQPAQYRNGRFVASHPSQGQRIAMAVFDNAGRDGNRASRGAEHDPQHHRRGAEPSVIFDQFRLQQTFPTPRVHFAAGDGTIRP